MRATPSTQRAALWQPSRTGRTFAAIVQVLLSTVLLAWVAAGTTWKGDATPTLVECGACVARA